ncbi:MAG: hypothetical protein Q7J78_04015 [Clostridiales bacterium]|nr:hypothetical protein [Clostridiales bacterium]
MNTLNTLKTDIYNRLLDIPLLDIHTHMDASHLGARGLHDILLYHMVISDLYSAGCPDGSRLTEEPSEDEVESRIKRALPYIKYIQNTSCFWGVRTILKDLYGWKQPITEENWKEIHLIISEKSKNPSWAREILKRAGIARVCTELWRGHGGIADDVLQYSLEWAFFTRCQWGQFDTALLELENAWGQEEPGAPLPVTMDRSSLKLKKVIKTIEDVKEAVKHYCDRIPYDKVLSSASHFSTDISYRHVTKEEMEQALSNRHVAGVKERDIYSNYINEQYLSEIEASGKDIVLQFSMGAEPLPFETGSKLRTETIFELAQIFSRHSGIKFSIFLSNEHQNQTMCTLARELPNVSMAGYWWHNFFPGTIRKVINERLDMLAANKQFGFFSDAYCADWAYAKAFIVRKQIAEVLVGKIEQGQYTEEQALDIARQILNETPQMLLKMTPAI